MSLPVVRGHDGDGATPDLAGTPGVGLGSPMPFLMHTSMSFGDATRGGCGPGAGRPFALRRARLRPAGRGPTTGGCLSAAPAAERPRQAGSGAMSARSDVMVAAGVLALHHRIVPTDVCEGPSATATCSYVARVGDGDRWFVKSYPRSADLSAERRALELAEFAALGGIPVPAMRRTMDGDLIATDGELAVSVVVFQRHRDSGRWSVRREVGRRRRDRGPNAPHARAASGRAPRPVPRDLRRRTRPTTPGTVSRPLCEAAPRAPHSERRGHRRPAVGSPQPDVGAGAHRARSAHGPERPQSGPRAWPRPSPPTGRPTRSCPPMTS